MNKLKTKRGFTLVELVVTIAVLGIVAGLGVGMVAQAIKNYSTAQTTSTEQDNALEIEDFIINAARVGTAVDSVNTSSVPSNDYTAYYIFFDGGTLKTVRSEVSSLGEPPVVTTISYERAKRISVQVKKHKPEMTDAISEKCFFYLDYEIEMEEGYKLVGSIVMNNADKETVVTQQDDSYDDESELHEISSTGSSDALMIRCKNL